ncbi:PAS domain S-box protein [Dyadobacter subterraneus]|uniref:histidine kinase n=1 Tax=Dyadobacter subterraneus TaxID=2773304 RepID=A0ABR9WDH4_9BACT|nr:PAS domain S-box protein [Dyadobacter subterraneus]MBE9463530.1 PAS domain S-box protein [Dyadobacter subterraneus]
MAENLHERISRLENIIKASELGTWEWNIQTNEVIYNEHWAAILGYRLEELMPVVKDRWQKLIYPDDLISSVAALDDHLNGKTSLYQTEVRLRHKSGHWVWVLDKGKIVSRNSEGKPERMMCSHQDISGRKRSELLLAQYKELLQITKQAALIGSWELDLRLMKVSWSVVTGKIHQAPSGYNPGFHDLKKFYSRAGNALQIVTAINKAKKKAKTFDLEFQILTHLGNLKWVRLIGVPFYENNKCIRISGLVQDIDQKNKIIADLALQEEQFRQTFEHAANGMALLSLAGKWLRVNKSLCELLGYSQDELLKLTFQDITYEDDLDEDLGLVKELLDGRIKNYNMEKRYLHKNGSIVWVLLSVSMVRSDRGEPLHFISQINNITERKLLELRLQKTNDRLKAILDASTQVGIIETHLNGTIEIFNVGAENLLGYSENELVGKKTPEIFYSEQQLLERVVSENLNAVPKGFELLVGSVDSSNFDTREWTFIRKDASEFSASVTVTTVRDYLGIPKGYLFVFFDMSQLKEAETNVKSLLDMAQHQNRRLLDFANIVSHNLRSNAGNISMLLELLRNEFPQAADNEYYPMLEKATNNLLSTIGNLKDIVSVNYSSEKNAASLNVLKFVEQCMANLSAFILESGTMVSLEISKDINVTGTASYLESILINLLSNAIKYRAANRPLHIDVLARTTGSFVEICIRDNGRGIDLKKYGDKVFGLYRTFHGNQDAQGIGLFITKSQIEAMGGTINLISEPEVGTTFTITLFNADKVMSSH